MPIVVLVGFSCAGKSTLAEFARERWSDLRVLDSDKWLARDHLDEFGEPHIYGLFAELGRDLAIQHIEAHERRFLAEQRSAAGPVLIAAGPALVSRQPEWQQFVDRLQPSFIYLTQTVEQAAAGLRKRRQRQIGSQLAHHPSFGAWDEDVMTAHDGDRWVDIPPERIILNVRRHMRQLVELYETLAPDARDRFSVEEARSNGGRERALARIAEHLGLSH